MYLREMGGVELLSREGEIAIAKRIEAGKDVMINALTQSPLVAKKIYEWKEKIESNELLVRDIIDIDSTYEDFEAIDEEEKKVKAEAKSKKIKDEGKKDFDLKVIIILGLISSSIFASETLNSSSSSTAGASSSFLSSSLFFYIFYTIFYFLKLRVPLKQECNLIFLFDIFEVLNSL